MIRHAIPTDSAALARVQIDSWRSAYRGLLPDAYLAQFTYEEQTQDWRDLIAEPGTQRLYVATDEADEVIGYALCRPADEDGFGYQMELVAIHVLPTHKRQGVGRRLIAALTEEFAREGISSLMLWVLADNPVRAFYERLGGQWLGEMQREIGGASVKEVAYGWPDIALLNRAAQGA